MDNVKSIGGSVTERELRESIAFQIEEKGLVCPALEDNTLLKIIKNRVIKKELFEQLNTVMKKGGKLFLKTDLTMYYEYVLELLKDIPGYKVIYNTEDLYATEKITDNIPTEFEQLFTGKGVKIKYIEIEKEV